jgi:xylan 1,4-beta-xylosidase
MSNARAEPTAPPATPPIAVAIDIDLNTKLGPWKPVHRFYGADEPNYAYMPAGKRLLGELGKTSPDAPVYFRTHNLFTTGDGTPALKWGSTNVYTEDAQGNAVYDYTILDRIFDVYRDAGVLPYFQLGFMPEAMSTHPQPYRHHWTPKLKYDEVFTGWAYPPKDFKKWEELCFQVTKHCVERYGRGEVEKWYFQTWNEPNIGYWKGTREEFFKLHDHAMAGVKRALPTARVGGPDTAGDGGEFQDAFLKHVLEEKNFATGETGTPTDFVSFHAKGSPIATKEGFVRMGIAAQLKTMDKAFARYAKNPKTKSLPIVIGESDPEGCAACQGPQFAYRNGTVYSSYTAASFARCIELADKHGVNLEGVLTWAFEFEGYPPFAGFRALASGEIDHPVLNVFRMFAQLKGDRVKTTNSGSLPLDEIVQNGVRAQPDIGALATTSGNKAFVLLWNYHDDDVPGPAAEIALSLKGLPTGANDLRIAEQRIDETEGNAFTKWKAMGSPEKPGDDEVAEIAFAAQLGTTQSTLSTSAGGPIKVTLPRQGVSLITIEWKAP